MTHAGIPIEAQIEAGMSPGGIRLSIGLEHPADLIADLEQGLAALRAPAPRYTESLVQI
jgi:cystathionine beta-lyase/cystathionine gamma-synthase